MIESEDPQHSVVAERAQLRTVYDHWREEYDFGAEISPPGLRRLVEYAQLSDDPTDLLATLRGPLVLQVLDIDAPSPANAFQSAEAAVVNNLADFDPQVPDRRLFDSILAVASRAVLETDQPDEIARLAGKERERPRSKVNKISFHFQITDDKFVNVTYSLNKYRELKRMHKVLLGLGFLTTVARKSQEDRQELLTTIVNKGWAQKEILLPEDVEEVIKEALKEGYIEATGDGQYSLKPKALEVLKPRTFKLPNSRIYSGNSETARASTKSDKGEEKTAGSPETVINMVEEYVRLAHALGRPSLAKLLEGQYPAADIRRMEPAALEAAQGYVRPLLNGLREKQRAARS